MESTDPVLTDNEAESRFEIHVDGELAGFVRYERQGQLLDLMHTQVGERFQGAGLAGQLARYSLETARARGLRVLPTCPYIRKWMRQHPGHQDVVPPERRAEFGLES
jgi:uncharacterized protein